MISSSGVFVLLTMGSILSTLSVSVGVSSLTGVSGGTIGSPVSSFASTICAPVSSSLLVTKNSSPSSLDAINITSETF